MKNIKLSGILKAGKRTFTSNRIPVASVLGRNLIFGNDSQAIINAVRAVAKHGEQSEKIVLKTKISESELETIKQ